LLPAIDRAFLVSAKPSDAIGRERRSCPRSHLADEPLHESQRTARLDTVASARAMGATIRALRGHARISQIALGRLLSVEADDPIEVCSVSKPARTSAM
jgi:hypothetical protein